MVHNRVIDSDEFNTAVRLQVYQHIIDTGEPPSAVQTATTLNRFKQEALFAYRRPQRRAGPA